MSVTQSKHKVATAFSLLLIGLVSLSCAAPGMRDRPTGPPPEAVEACASLSEGDACSFTGRRRDNVQGTCFVPPEDEAGLACRPEGGRPPRPERPYY